MYREPRSQDSPFAWHQAVSQYVINEGAGLGGQGGGAGGGYNWGGSPEGQGGEGNRGAGGQGTDAGNAAMWGDKVTIGEALEATAKIAGDKSVEPSDVAAIQAVESAATGVSTVLTNGVAAAAQAAVVANTWADREDDETKLGDVLAVVSILGSSLYRSRTTYC